MRFRGLPETEVTTPQSLVPQGDVPFLRGFQVFDNGDKGSRTLDLLNAIKELYHRTQVLILCGFTVSGNPSSGQ